MLYPFPIPVTAENWKATLFTSSFDLMTLYIVHEVENKLTDLTGRLERSEVNLTSEVGQERDNLQKVEERVNNIQVNIREIHEKINKVMFILKVFFFM